MREWGPDAALPELRIQAGPIRPLLQAPPEAVALLLWEEIPMSRAILNRIAGEDGDTITIPLQESNGDASDLSGQTSVSFQARLEGDVPGVDTLRIDGTMTVVGAETLGIVSYVVQAGDFVIAGIYLVQIKAVFSGPTKNLTWDVLYVIVAEKHG